MSSIQSTHMQTAAGAQGAGVPASLVLLMATTAGVGVASLYYSQPMLGCSAPTWAQANAPWALCPR